MDKVRERPVKGRTDPRTDQHRKEAITPGCESSSEAGNTTYGENGTTAEMEVTTQLAKRLIPLDLDFHVRKRLADLSGSTISCSL